MIFPYVTTQNALISQLELNTTIKCKCAIKYLLPYMHVTPDTTAVTLVQEVGVFQKSACSHPFSVISLSYLAYLKQKQHNFDAIYFYCFNVKDKLCCGCRMCDLNDLNLFSIIWKS